MSVRADANARRLRAGPILGAALALLAVGCNPGSYPVDVFPEMHYQAWHRPLEPTRLSAPQDAVPVNGRPPSLTYPQAAELSNPVPRTPATLALASRVYVVNCAVCHGPEGDGRTVMARYFAEAGAVPPTDLASARVRLRTDGQLYWIVRNGLGNMPPFADLLDEEEAWLAVLAVREIGTQ